MMAVVSDQPVPEQPLPAGGEPDDRTARRARSFGAVAADYHLARTRYSPDAVRWALEQAGAGVLDVLDLAAGTGLLTATLLTLTPRPVVRAVEPDAGMRAEYARHAPGIEIRAGTAESIPLPDAAVDVVVVGTAFHWFDTRLALPEIARVLRAGGVLAALWTGPDDEVAWVRDYRAAARAGLAESHVRGRDRHARGLGVDDSPLFGESEERFFRHSEVRSVTGLAGAAATYSEVLTATEAEREAVLRLAEARLRERLAAVGPPAGGPPDSLEIPVAVRVVRARRLAGT